MKILAALRKYVREYPAYTEDAKGPIVDYAPGSIIRREVINGPLMALRCDWCRQRRKALITDEKYPRLELLPCDNPKCEPKRLIPKELLAPAATTP